MKNFFLSNPTRTLTGLTLVLILPFIAFTAGATTDTGAPISDVGDVFGLIDTIFNILFVLLILAAAIYIILAAFAYLTAGGDPEKVQKANHRLIYAAVAVVVAVLAKAIPNVVCDFLGTNCNIQVD